MTASFGLSTEDAERRLAKWGHNELPERRTRSFLTNAAHAVAEPMLALLLVAAGIYLFLGDRVEALFLGASVIAILAITLYQQHKTERVLAALRDLSSPRALVFRDGVERRIPGRDVVIDDVILVREGDRVAADAELIEAADLSVDESLLTGESVPVAKQPAKNPASTSDGVHTSRLYSGTLVVKGHGVARVTATGPRSEMGQIGRSLEELGIEATGLQAETLRIVRAVAVIALLLCTLLVVVFVLRGGRLAERHPRRTDARNGDPARRIPGRSDRVPRAGRLAHDTPQGPDASNHGNRGTRRCDRSLRRQDRDADREPHVGTEDLYG
jgi:Ca2+-transporting ATPase